MKLTWNIQHVWSTNPTTFEFSLFLIILTDYFLSFICFQIFFITDLLFAFLRREFDLRTGLTHKLENGKDAQVILD